MNRRYLILMGAMAVLFILTMPGLSVLATPTQPQTNPGTKAIELGNVVPSDVVYLDKATLLSKAIGDQRISLDIDGNAVSFALTEGRLFDSDVQVFSDDARDAATARDHLANMHFFTGIDLVGAEKVVAFISPSFMSISVTMLDGVEYQIRPYDSTDSGHYAVYSNADVRSTGWANIDGPETSATIGSTVLESNAITGLSGPSSNDVINDPSTSAQTSTADLSGAIAAQGLSNSTGMSMLTLSASESMYSLARVILACDSNYYAAYQTSWSDRLASTLWYVNTLYQSQVKISFQLVAILNIPGSYCMSTDATMLGVEFRDYVYDTCGHRTDHDIAHLFSGKNLDGDTLGLASYTPGAARTKWNPSQYGACSISEQTHDDFENQYLLGHEIGHSFNGDHDFAGTVVGKYSWEYSGYSSGNMVMQFTPQNVQRIATWARQAMDTQKLVNPGPSSTSSDNLQASLMVEWGDWIYQVGRTATVTYSLKNVGASSIVLGYAFVAARDASGVNRDFGNQNGITIGAQQTYSFTASYTPQSSGEWTLWPAYYVSGHYGPYQWLAIHPTMYYNLTSTYWSGHDTQNWASQPVSLFYRLCMFSNVQTPTVGSTVWMYFTMYDGAAGTGSNTFNSIFVACLNPSGGNADFGSVSQPNLQQVGDQGEELVGGGCTIFASKVLSSSGTWLFWPCYNINGDWGQRWLTRSITV
jgi:hypothetical protein